MYEVIGHHFSFNKVIRFTKAHFLLSKQPHDVEMVQCLIFGLIFWQATSIRMMTGDKSIIVKYNCQYSRLCDIKL